MDTLTLRSSIRPSLMRYSLWRGAILAGIGVILLLTGGAFLPAAPMKIWGLPLFLVGIALITWGWLPYRRLRRLEMNPHRLIIEKDWLHFSANNQTLLSIPWESVAQFKYMENGRNYGMGIELKKPLPQQIIVHAGGKGGYGMPVWKCYGCDLFLPYFSERAME